VPLVARPRNQFLSGLPAILAPLRHFLGWLVSAFRSGPVTVREIGEAIGRGLKVPVVPKSPGDSRPFWLAGDLRWSRPYRFERANASTAGMAPNWAGLIADLEQMCYSEIPADSVSAAPVRHPVD
jgi:hypothetical protein